MTPESRNRRIHVELDSLVTQGLMSPEARAKVGERYATGPIDLAALARWFTVLGAIAIAAGLTILVRDHAGMWVAIEGGLALLGATLLAGGWYVRHRRGMERSGGAVEMLGGMSLQGLVVALAVHHSTGSDNWPALVGIVTILGVILAYLLGNKLLLILAGVEAFVWFGGSTGYVSGWGAWWLGMTYPARFIAAGLVFLVLAWIHSAVRLGPANQSAPSRWQSFSRVYAHLGLLDIHLALWFLSVFGWFTDLDNLGGPTGERLAFSAIWMIVSMGCVLAASFLGLRMLRSYGLTFLLIDVYTFYFQFVAWNSADAWFIHLVIMGGALVAGGFFLERQLRRRPGGS